MRLVFTAAAEDDLEGIGDHIAMDSPERALSFVHEIAAHAMRLLNMPKAHPLIPRYEATGIRRCVHGRYLIFYRVDADAVVILRILHGAMDYEPLLFPE
ncbi:type II toxin-antitoxin system RelE/ParE family toxin [Xanthobacter oligotrophicus]|uniref:type II toxin-antitoxin system RelE/ParE family toxin n=1 Tax=Xanthobacter oligotrophicus TaxID=2607286 RepID=UPI0011F2F2F7|nr:type II toxin-antitoxin system RelE/ParE family toxin [Xanthobacter oligotrophicus]MCG5236847.1 type II toxin-antitoxin system RelE/ParE family toxin [Xanthobacter oligotrophicus]